MPADSSQSSAHTAGGGRSTCGATRAPHKPAVRGMIGEILVHSHATLCLEYSSTSFCFSIPGGWAVTRYAPVRAGSGGHHR